MALGPFRHRPSHFQVGSQGDGSAQLVCKSEADQAGEVAEFLEISNLAMGNPSLFFCLEIFFNHHQGQNSFVFVSKPKNPYTEL